MGGNQNKLYPLRLDRGEGRVRCRNQVQLLDFWPSRLELSTFNFQPLPQRRNWLSRREKLHRFCTVSAPKQGGGYHQPLVAQGLRQNGALFGAVLVFLPVVWSYLHRGRAGTVWAPPVLGPHQHRSAAISGSAPPARGYLYHIMKIHHCLTPFPNCAKLPFVK